MERSLAVFCRQICGQYSSSYLEIHLLGCDWLNSCRPRSSFTYKPTLLEILTFKCRHWPEKDVVWVGVLLLSITTMEQSPRIGWTTLDGPRWSLALSMMVVFRISRSKGACLYTTHVFRSPTSRWPFISSIQRVLILGGDTVRNVAASASMSYNRYQHRSSIFLDDLIT